MIDLNGVLIVCEAEAANSASTRVKFIQKYL